MFFGHYWMAATDTPASLTDNVACLDYGIVRTGPLVADRWSGEKRRERGSSWLRSEAWSKATRRISFSDHRPGCVLPGNALPIRTRSTNEFFESCALLLKFVWQLLG